MVERTDITGENEERVMSLDERWGREQGLCAAVDQFHARVAAAAD